MGRAPCCDKANVKKGPWSPEEDAELKAYIEEKGTGGNWIALPQKIGLKRCGKSCRLRWLNYLRPNLKHGQFSEKEDQTICSLYISIGSRWSIIAAQLPGRTDNDIKNYWNTKLKKKLFGKQRESSNPRRLSINQELGGEEPQWISAAALERIQLHMQLRGLELDSPLSLIYSNPALWPKYHPLGDMNLQGQQSNSITAIQEPINTTFIEPPPHKTMINHGMMTNAVNANPLEKLVGSPLYYSSPSTSAAISSDNSNSNFNPMDSRLQAELEDMFSGKNYNSSGGQEDHNLDLDCFKGINGEEHELNWWASNGFDEKSSTDSWGSVSALQQDSMFHEYVTGYDL